MEISDPAAAFQVKQFGYSVYDEPLPLNRINAEFESKFEFNQPKYYFFS